MHVFVQNLQHESVAAEDDDHVRLGALAADIDELIARRKLGIRRLGFGRAIRQNRQCAGVNPWQQSSMFAAADNRNRRVN